MLATLLFGAVLLGPLSALTAPGGTLDRRWTMIGADGLRLVLLVLAPLWIDWTPRGALIWLLVTVFLMGAAERVWTVARESAAPGLLPAPPIEGAAVRPLPDNLDALRRLTLRTAFVALPLAAAALMLVTLLGNLLGTGISWFQTHQAALGSYVAAGLFAASVSILYFVQLPALPTPRPRSPLEGLRRPKRGPGAGAGQAGAGQTGAGQAVGGQAGAGQAGAGPAGDSDRNGGGDGSGAADAGGGVDKGRTGAVPLLVLACAATAAAIAAAVAVCVLHAVDLGGGPVGFALLVLALSGGPVLGIRGARKVLPTLSRRRLLALAVAVTGLALLAMGLVPDTTTVLLLALLAGFGAGVTANTGHTLLEQETEEPRAARMTGHLHAVVRLALALAAVLAPLLAAAIGPHHLGEGAFVFAHGGAAFVLMLAGALLLPVAAWVLSKLDDRQGVPLRRDLRAALHGAEPAQAPFPTGFFIALDGGDGAGKSTQVQALAEWIRGKGHEVVVTREPGATAIGKRLRSIILDVKTSGLSDRAEALLFAADRAEHVNSVIRPALERGAVVITDRYIDSSVAYQGAGRNLAPTEIARISRWATEGLVPHLTVLLDVSPQTARERFTEAPDRMESEPAEFHQRVRTGFLTLAAADPARYLVVDAGQEPEAVTTVVRHRLDQVLPLSEAEIKARDEARRAAEEEARRKAEEEAARKAEEERAERERQEQLAKLRAEEEERKRREIEEAKAREAARQAEEARRRAEEARQAAEEERRRRAAEERARAAEAERRRKQAEEEARLRAEAEERRLEKQRKAEEALLRAEQARLAAAAAASNAAAAGTAAAGGSAGAGGAGDSDGAADSRGVAGTVDSDAPTTPTPVVNLRKGERADGGPEDSPGADVAGATGASSAPGASGVTGVTGVPGAADETAVLPPVRPVNAADETAVLPPVQPQGRVTWPGTPAHGGDRQGGPAPQDRRYPQPGPRQPHLRQEDDPADRVPPWVFRPEEPRTAMPAPDTGVERTRELPQIDPATGRPVEPAPRDRPRPSWAEETPLDDLPTLADELLGPRGDERAEERGAGGWAEDGDDGGRGQGRGRRGRRG
ncbi:dTMP kinase [Streptomyces sp. MST-110588]|nr:dTMP kinase [Streptomyces sp. MST-110588]